MFHIFEGFENPDSTATARGRQNERRESVGRRVTTLRACTSCRHRKIKCDGEKPCEACRWYKKSDSCHYSDPRPSRRHVEKLSTSLEEYRSVLEKLFPDVSPESLVHLPREQLLGLLGKVPAQLQPHAPHSASPESPPSIDPHGSPIFNEDGNLESLQSMPEEVMDEKPLSTANNAIGVTDDVNALSLSGREPSSYLGVSSIQAVLKVIVWLEPGSLCYFPQTPGMAGQQNTMDFSSTENIAWHAPGCQHQAITPPQVHLQMSEAQLIDAYFTYVQPFVPMLDEPSFRKTYLSGRRKDDRWLGLLNVVLALGSIVASTSDDTSHQTYFRRCRSHLGLDSLGSSHLETIQAVGLVAGYYLHYVSQPNLAYSLMGAALRMAAALGLHKEFSDNRKQPCTQGELSMDLKRRVWWSLFCLDTWGSMTLGRPSMGRFGPTISAGLPHYRDTGNVLKILPLLESIRFCKIATQIQEVLAVAPLVKHLEMSHFDSQLLEWYDNLPAILKNHEPCSESIAITRTVMRWRYLNQRMLLYRPTLLSYAMRRVPYMALRSEERMAIEKCREIAEATIQDISATAQLNQMSGWNGVWLIFQAVMVPLLGLFLNDNTDGDPRAMFDSCQAQVNTAMILLARMQPWSPTGGRTLDVVSRIFEASKRGTDMMVGDSCYPPMPGSNLPAIPSAILPSQPDMGRGVVIANDGGLPDSLIPPFLDESAGQNLWDFLSWSDSSLWPDFENPSDPIIFGPDDKTMKYSGSNGILFDNLPDAAYIVNHPVPFY